jgi:CRISPR-associated protein Cas1
LGEGFGFNKVTGGRAMEQTAYLPVSSVAEILYCPRNFYYRSVLGASDRNSHVLEGKWQEETRDEVRTKLRPTGIQTRKVYLASENLRLAGILDTIEENNGCMYPVEFKKGLSRENLNDQVQLCLQALLLEEHLETHIDSGYLYYGESYERRKVEFTEDLREIALTVLEKARTIIEEGIIPEQVNDNRCNGCSLVDRCLPEETKAITQEFKGKVRKPSPSMNLGRVLYIDSPGAYLKKEQGRIKLKLGEEVRDIPLSAIDQVVLGQPAAVSGSLMAAMCDVGVSCYFLDRGKVKGWLQPVLSKNVILRKAQYAANLCGEHNITFAKAFVEGKITNQRTILLRYNRSLADKEIETVVNNLGLYVKQLKKADSVPSIMGIEGLAAREYFSVFARLLKDDLGFSFTNRNRRPPKDPVNCLLSFAYSLLTKDVIEAIIRVGLDPYLGFFHTDKYGRPALALDLMEEFRPIISDSVVITAINTKTVKIDDFN